MKRSLVCVKQKVQTKKDFKRFRCDMDEETMNVTGLNI